MADTTWRKHIKFLPQGALIQSFKIGNHNIVLGFRDPARYQAAYNPFFGETIGRCANRISNARIESLNDRKYDLAANNGPNTLHGGLHGWGKKTFTGPTNLIRNGKDTIEFTYLSRHGEEGFPGTVELKVWYSGKLSQSAGKQQLSLEIEYEAQLIGDEVEATVINVCNHSYFNISGAPTIEGTSVTLSTDLHQETDSNDIPTGSIKPFPGIQAGVSFMLGKEQPDIDHCFVMDDNPQQIPIDTRSQPLRKLCDLLHAKTGLRLEAYSTEPAFQFYTGKYIEVPKLDDQPAIGPRSGICIEASRYVNAINNEHWRSMVVLKKGQKYGSKTIYTASEQ